MHLPKGRVLSSILVPLKCCSFYWEHSPSLFLIICFTSDSLGLTFNPCSSHPCWGQLSIDSTHFHESTHWQASLYTNTTHFFPPALGLHSWCREVRHQGMHCTAQRGRGVNPHDRKKARVSRTISSFPKTVYWVIEDIFKIFSQANFPETHFIWLLGEQSHNIKLSQLHLAAASL